LSSTSSWTIRGIWNSIKLVRTAIQLPSLRLWILERVAFYFE
jgi:hypothetical protein